MTIWQRHKQRCSKLIVIFLISHQKFCWQSLIKIQRLSQKLFMSEFQYQMMFGLNLLKPRPLFGVILKVCQTKFHQIWISKSKVLHLQIPVPKWEKTKKWEKLFWLTKRDNKGITDPGRSLVIAKFFIFKFQYQNGKKQKSGKNFSGLQNGTIRELQIRAGL